MNQTASPPATGGSPIEVLLVSHRADLTGAPLCLADLACGCDPKRFRIRALLGEHGSLFGLLQSAAESGAAPDIGVRLYDRKRRRGPGQLMELRRLLRELKPQVVQVLQAAAFSKSVAIAARSLGIPVVWHLHNNPDLAKFGRRRVWVRLLANRVVACSESIARYYPGLHSRLIRNGVRIPETAAAGRDDTGLDLPAASFRFLFVGTLMEHKNVHLLVEAAVRVLQEQPDTAFVLVGGTEKPEYQQQLKRRCEAKGISRSVHFAGEVTDVTPYYRACDALVLPSQTECFPRVILEAAAYAVPAVASAVGDVPQVIEDGVTGWLLPVDSLAPDPLAEALLRVRRLDAGELQGIGQQARRDIAERNSMSAYVSSFESLWEELARR